MSKVNKVKIGLVILFIILLVSYTFVKSTKATENNETVEIEEDSTANGGGMEDNPFIIDGKTTVTYTALPFYFQVTSEGSYEIEHDVGNQKVTFTPVKSQSINSDGTTSIKVVYDRVGYSSLDNYQLGVTPEDGGDSAQAPVHSIEEVSYYYNRSWRLYG